MDERIDTTLLLKWDLFGVAQIGVRFVFRHGWFATYLDFK